MIIICAVSYKMLGCDQLSKHHHGAVLCPLSKSKCMALLFPPNIICLEISIIRQFPKPRWILFTMPSEVLGFLSGELSFFFM